MINFGSTISFLYIVLKSTDNFCRHTTNERIVRYVLRHHGTGSHHNVVANGDTWQNGHVAANPHIVSDTDGLSYAEVLAAPIGVSG